MSSLYQIEAELLEIFNTIEAQEGEITDEQYNQLVITEENFKEKLKSLEVNAYIYQYDYLYQSHLFSHYSFYAD